jgi:hypothetical protein
MGFENTFFEKSQIRALKYEKTTSRYLLCNEEGIL